MLNTLRFFFLIYGYETVSKAYENLGEKNPFALLYQLLIPSRGKIGGVAPRKITFSESRVVPLQGIVYTKIKRG